jgi:hypothetical protein
MYGLWHREHVPDTRSRTVRFREYAASTQRTGSLPRVPAQYVNTDDPEKTCQDLAAYDPWARRTFGLCP